MNIVREIRRISGKELTITLPEDFLETEVEILVLPLERGSRLSTWDKEEDIKKDILEAMKEVKIMREGKLPEKSARELLDEL